MAVDNDVLSADVVTWLNFVWRRLVGRCPVPLFDLNLTIKEFDDAVVFLQSCESWSVMAENTHRAECRTILSAISHSLVWAIDQFERGNFQPYMVGKGLESVREAVSFCRNRMRAKRLAETHCT